MLRAPTPAAASASVWHSCATWSACMGARSKAAATAATKAACSPCACRCTPLLSPSCVGLYHLPMHLNRYTVQVLEHFRSAPEIKTLPAGMTLFKAGDPADFVYILIDGQANLLVGKTIVEVAVRGNLLGEVALIDGKPRSATVVTRTQCQVLPIDAAQFHALMRELPEFSDYVMNAMAERMR